MSMSMSVANQEIVASLTFDAKKLDRLMQEADLDALVVTSRHNVQYLLGGYRFFFFDVMEAIGVSRYLPVFVYQRGRPENTVYLGNRMEGFEKELGHIPATMVKTATWGTTDAMGLAVDHIKKLGAGVKRIGIEPSFLPSDAKAVLNDRLDSTSLVDAQSVLERLRAVKTAAELDLIREASERVVNAMRATFDVCTPGMSKRDVVDRLRREEQERDLVFEYCLIAAGDSHNRAPSNQLLKEGDVISLDSGGNYKGYIGDLSRMGVLGDPDSELSDLLREVEEVQQVARRAIKPGALGGDIIVAGEEAARREPHGNVLDYTAHGIGLVSHEAPRITGHGPVPYAPVDADQPLQPGMVLSIETAMLHPARGYIKLEDTLIVTAEGWEAPGDSARGWNTGGVAVISK
jgi:Xaa-Pro aminopeptidase